MIFWNAFGDLHASRQTGFSGVEAIQISDITAYCALCGFTDPIFRVELLFMIQQMDEEWLTLQAAKQPKS